MNDFLAPDATLNRNLHDWQDAPPGCGPLRTCRKCGVRERSPYRELACDAAQRPGIAMHETDYDPHR